MQSGRPVYRRRSLAKMSKITRKELIFENQIKEITENERLPKTCSACRKLTFVHLKDSKKGFLRDFHTADLFHTLFAFLLFFKELAFA